MHNTRRKELRGLALLIKHHLIPCRKRVVCLARASVALHLIDTVLICKHIRVAIRNRHSCYAFSRFCILYNSGKGGLCGYLCTIDFSLFKQ